jgi:hypothetical protein
VGGVSGLSTEKIEKEKIIEKPIDIEKSICYNEVIQIKHRRSHHD